MPRTLFVILMTTFIFRMGYSLIQPPLTPYDRFAGGDEWWFLEYSYRQVTDIDMEPLASAPLYVLMVGGVRRAFQAPATDTRVLIAPLGGGLDIVSVPGEPSAGTVITVRVLQAIFSTATVYFVYHIARTLGDGRSGLVAAGAVGAALAMAVSAAQIMTETLYIFWLTGATALYLTGIHDERETQLRWGWFASVGLLFALATLTRAVLILFPVGIAAHGLVVWWAQRRRRGWSVITRQGIGVLLVVYTLACGTWTAYYYLRWDEIVIGARGISAFFYLGTQPDVQGPEGIDDTLGATADDPIDDAAYVAGAQAVIQSNPVGYVAGRVNNLLRTYAQPYGTAAFPGESLKALAADWLQAPTISGLGEVLRGAGFVPKLLIYLTHGLGIGLGVIGMAVSWRRWETALVAFGLIAYVTLVHLVLLALPRYLFPTLPFWWCFAGVAVVRGWDGLSWRRRAAALEVQGE